MIVSERGDAERSPGFVVNCLRIASRRQWALGVPIALGLLGGLVAAASIIPTYIAEATLALDARKVQVIDIGSVVSRLPEENAALRTELDAIDSRSMADLVADRLRFESRPDLLAAMNPPPRRVVHAAFSAVTDTLASWAGISPAAEGRALEAMSQWWEEATAPLRRLFAPAPTPEPVKVQTAASAAAAERARIVDWLLGGLHVSNDGRSFTIYVSFASVDPVISAEVANAFAAAYLDDLVGMKVRAARSASDWLHQRLEEMRHQVEVSETAVFQFRREAGLLQFRGDTIASQQISELNSQLGVVRTERSRLDARIQNTMKAAASNASAAGDLTDVEASPLIQALRRKIGDNDAKLADLRDRGALRHPDTLALESQQTALKQQLAAETQRVIGGLKEEAASTGRQEAQLQNSLHAMAARYGQAGEAVIRLNQLEREADANRAIYESFLNRYKETIEQQGLTPPEARVLSLAEPPALPASSKRLPVLGLGLLFGLLVGIILATFRERVDERPYEIFDVERLSGAPVIGLLPRISRFRRAPELAVVHQARGPFSEAIRRTQATLCLPSISIRARVIMVTSAVAGEGKTSFSTALARSLAISGQRVLVIDADLRMPRLAAAFGLPSQPGTQNVLAAELPLEDAVQIDPLSGAHVLTAVADDGALLAGLRGMGWETLIRPTRDRYDVVIVDTAPVTGAPDAAAIGACVDMRLFLVRWRGPTRTVLAAALRFLHLCGVKVDGVVITRTKARRPPSYLASYGSDFTGNPMIPNETRALRGPTPRPV